MSRSYLPQDGVSPLFIASQLNHKEVVTLLLKAGANPDAARLEVRGIGLVDCVPFKKMAVDDYVRAIMCRCAHYSAKILKAR